MAIIVGVSLGQRNDIAIAANQLRVSVAFFPLITLNQEGEF